MTYFFSVLFGGSLPPIIWDFLYCLRNLSLPEDHQSTSLAPPTDAQAKACLLNTEPFFLLVRKPNLLCYLR